MKKLTILLFAVTALGVGCKKFTNINTNVNQPTTVTPNVVLSAALQGSAADVGTDFTATTRWMGYWARSGNYIQTIPTETYAIASDYADGDFQSLYVILSRYNYIETTGKANASTEPFYIGVAKIMKALHFSTLVDGFNNVPYSQAFNLTKYPTPAYDDAKTIYADLITQLDSSVYYLNKAILYYHISPSTVVTTDDQYDIMFGRATGGSDTVKAAVRLKKWIRLSNTIKLKLLLTEESAVTSTYIHAELAKSSANKQGYIVAGESAAVNPGYTSSSAAQLNPFYGLFYTTAGQPTTNYSFFRANNYSVNFANNTGDERTTAFYASNTPAGNYDGDPNALSNTYTTGLGTGILPGPTADQLIISDFESLYMQAEAVQRGYTEVSASSAATLLQQATEQSYVYLGLPASDGDDYLAGDPGDPLVDITAGNALQTILTQKWAALNGINWEQAYTDYRRTGYPLPDGSNFGFSHAQNVVTHNGKVALPFRYLYPQSEINTNGKNIPSGTSAYTTIFWDTREK